MHTFDGVYVHIPFCAARCDYCAFATWTDRHHLIDDYLRAVAVEVERAVADGLGPVDTVFVGGGTPSLVPADGLMEVVARIPRRPDAEVTLEANPESVTAASLQTYRDGGATRMSFGVQSMDPSVLRSLGRAHDPEAVVAAVDAARAAGFETFNLDLIMGAAGETIASWEASLDAVLALDPPHVSAYGLTVEPGTPLAAQPERHPDEDDQATKYLQTDARLRAAGLEWYEVSNWARSGHECRHNQMYWRGGNYLGIGCAAHSHFDGRRWWNVRTPERYVSAVAEGRRTRAAGEDLDAATRELEALQLGLRTRAGVPVSALDVVDPDLDGLVDVAEERAVLTVRGRLLANEVALRLHVDRGCLERR